MTLNPNFHPLTNRYTGRVNRIITAAGVSLPYDPRKGSPNSLQQPIEWGDALWDTGATGSVITEKIATRIGLVPTGKRDVRTGSGLEVWNTYLVNIHLTNGTMLFQTVVAACPDPDADFDVIIGMDVITQGDFAITNVGDNTVMSFRTPSMETIDYENELKSLRGPAQRSGRTGRNDPCHCGSGKKYKHCCGRGKGKAE